MDLDKIIKEAFEGTAEEAILEQLNKISESTTRLTAYLENNHSGRTQFTKMKLDSYLTGMEAYCANIRDASKYINREEPGD